MAITKLYDFASDPDVLLDGQAVRSRAGQFNDIYDELINAALRKLLGAKAIYFDLVGSEDTDADGDILIDLSTQFSAISDWELDVLDDDVAYTIAPYRTTLVNLVGDITVADLVIGETITGGTSSATLKILSGTVTVGVGRTLLCRVLTGTPTPGGEVFTGAAGTLTTAATEVAVTNQIVARLFIASTGASHDTQSGVGVSWRATGTPA